MQSIRPIVAGLATRAPGLYDRFKSGTGGTVSAPYCYGVWIKHLSIGWATGLRAMPKTIAELGPGDSLGVGIAGLLSGVDHYLAFDVVAHADTQRNLRILDELTALFAARAPTPDRDGVPPIAPYLDQNWFPSHILTETRLDQALHPDRLRAIREALRRPGQGEVDGISIDYCASWDQTLVDVEPVADMIYSHSVLEHVEDLPTAYAAMRRWIKPGGFMSHQIDFTCHGLARAWNGHWAYSDPVWWMVKGNRPYLLNREPHATHVRLVEDAGFTIVRDQRHVDLEGLPRERLAPRFRTLPAEEVSCAGTLLQTVPADLH